MINLEEKFLDSFQEIQRQVHANAVDKGFWDASDNDGEKIALMHSELSEALEGLREGDPRDDKIPKFKSSEAELADVVIRIMDFAGKHNLRVAEAIIEKVKFNQSREKLHGKAF